VSACASVNAVNLTMFTKRGLSLGIWKPKNPHSLDHLKYLYSVLYKNQTVTENNKGLLVETLRSIAEILIWGDQNDSSVFDFFLERNMLSFFLKIMNQKCGSYVCVQLLQTLNILFENIRNETSIYYLLSNNHVNSIIVHKFDFSDEEVMAYYISFLKTLSFRLNKHTIHFFYNEHTNDFPLYTEAIKFFNHSESMVRIAVRTLTLNVYRVDDESMLQFVIDKTAVPYFSNLVWFIGNHILEIDTCVKNDADHQSLNRLKDLVAEHLDHLHYLNDILCLQIDNLNRVLTEHLVNRLFIPLYIYSLVKKFNTNSIEVMKPHISRVTALFLLCHVFLILTHAPLVRLLAWIIFSGDSEIFTERGAAKLSLYTSSKVLESEDFGCRGNTIVLSAQATSSGGTSNALENSSTLDERSRSRVKPGFAAPARTLEKLLQEQISSSAPHEDQAANFNEKYRTKKEPSTEESECEGDESITRQEPGAASMSPQAQTATASIPEVEKESSMSLPDGVDTGDLHVEEAADPSRRREAGEEDAHENQFSLEGRPFMAEIFEALNCLENDYLPLFSLCLIFAMQENVGISKSLLKSVGIPCKSTANKSWYNTFLVEKLLNVLYSACQYGSRIRLITLDVAIAVIKQLTIYGPTNGDRVSGEGGVGMSFLSDNHFAQIEGIKEESILLLRNFYKSEEIFLDMFEDEWGATSGKPLPRIDLVLSDASLLLPPTGTPLTGIDFTKRLPCGEVERARKAIRTFFRLRQLSLDAQGMEETHLPLSSPDSCVQVQDVLDLNNSDLLAVRVVTSSNSVISIGHSSNSGSKSSSVSATAASNQSRLFLVVDIYQIVLVEPDSKRLGWGVAIFAGFLQDIEVVSDKEDSRCLHVSVHGPARTNSSAGRPSFNTGRATPTKSASASRPLLSATFTFDDHIRCMAAKQRLTKGRTKARQRKMHQIARLLELPGNVGPSCPSPPAMVNLHSLRKEAAAHRRSRNNTGSRSGQGSSSISGTQVNKSRPPQHFGGMTLSGTASAVSADDRSHSAPRPSGSGRGGVGQEMSAAPTDDSDAASDYSSSSSFNHHRLQQEAVNKLSSLATDHDRQSTATASVSSRGSGSLSSPRSKLSSMGVGAVVRGRTGSSSAAAAAAARRQLPSTLSSTGSAGSDAGAGAGAIALTDCGISSSDATEQQQESGAIGGARPRVSSTRNFSSTPEPRPQTPTNTTSRGNPFSNN